MEPNWDRIADHNDEWYYEMLDDEYLMEEWDDDR